MMSSGLVDSHIMTGVADASLPTSSSVCMIFLIRACAKEPRQKEPKVFMLTLTTGNYDKSA